jgi:hypothetical protein
MLKTSEVEKSRLRSLPACNFEGAGKLGNRKTHHCVSAYKI